MDPHSGLGEGLQQYSIEYKGEKKEIYFKSNLLIIVRCSQNP